MVRTAAIILGGGLGERFRDEIPKQFVRLAGKMVIEHTVDTFEKHPLIDKIYLVVYPSYFRVVKEAFKGTRKVKKIVKGGRTRQESAMRGILACPSSIDNVLIHDAVRPFVSPMTISEVIGKLRKYPAVDVAIPSSDTLIGKDGSIITDIPTRAKYWRGQTPQGFHLGVIKKAHQLAKSRGVVVTDDCSLVHKFKLGKIYIVEGKPENLKITYPLDIFMADKIFQERKESLILTKLDELKRKLGGKTIVIFGGTSGIGLKIAKYSKKLEMKVYPSSRRTGVDIRNRSHVRRFLKQIRQKEQVINLIINTAALLDRNKLCSMTYKSMEEQLDTNLKGSLIVAKEGLPYLRESNGVLLLFTSSSYSMGRAGYTPYSATKAGLVNLVQGLSQEEPKVRINAFCPERTNTPMRRKAFGKESKRDLLSSDSVALATLIASVSPLSGSVIYFKKRDESKIKRLLNGF